MIFSSLMATLQAADTVVMIQARGALDTAASLATVAIAVVLLLILGALLLLLFHLREVQRHGSGLSRRLVQRLDPMLDRSREIVANVEFITGALRTDVQTMSSAVHSLSERLQGASDRMEQRVEEFNALMEVVQTEAEDIFIGSAAAIHGVRAGARALRTGERGDADPRAERGEVLDEEAAALEAETGLPPRPLGPAAGETERAPLAAPGGVQVTGGGESEGTGRRSSGA